MKQAVLYVFAISHFCEKARWALDFYDIPYQVRYLMPGVHAATAKKMGAKTSSLPILVVDNELVQGSGDIIDWAENESSLGKSLAPKAAEDASGQLEQRLDSGIGAHARRYYYSEALVQYPKTVLPMFSHGLSLAHKLMLRGAWNMVRQKMIERMDLGTAQGLASKAIVETELDWLDMTVADNKEFLLGDNFSRIDLAAASLLAPLVIPLQHPTYAKLAIPPQVSQDLIAWKNRPSFNWVRSIYKQYR